MALPAGLYFIRRPLIGGGGLEFHVYLEDAKWSAGELMTPVTVSLVAPNPNRILTGPSVTVISAATYTVSLVKRLGAIPINSLAFNGDTYKSATYKSGTGFPQEDAPLTRLYRGVPPDSYPGVGSSAGYRSDPLITGSDDGVIIKNALRENLYDDDGNAYENSTFYQNRSQLLSAWIFQEHRT